MRKKYIDKVSYYSLLEELTNLPDKSSSQPLYYSEKMFLLTDVFVFFTKASEFERFEARFFSKRKTDRVSVFSRQIFEISLEFYEVSQFVFNEKVRTVSDFLVALLGECKEYTQSLKRIDEVQ